ncbi:MAG: hypothetical protein ACKVE4_00100 [Dissulfuribacterales bacterium]
MTTASKISKQLIALFTKQPCWMIAPLADELRYSIPSVRRFLTAVGYYNSFTHNGKWYTLRSIPKFNRDGLWFHYDSEISYLGYKFISCLAACHQRATPKICQSMGRSGGYVLHLDATHDGNAPALMTGMDSLSEIVLGNVKIPSEHTDHIVPFLQKLQKGFGTPQACVHDMGKGICKAVSEVFPGISDFICHFHFLRDIGKDFLEPAYSSLRSCLRKHKTSPRLHALAREIKQRLSGQDTDPELQAKAILSGELPENTDLLILASAYSMSTWILQGKHSGDAYGFLFDRPLLVFAERLLEGQQYLPKLLDSCHDTDKIGKQSIIKLARIVSDIINDTRFSQGV